MHSGKLMFLRNITGVLLMCLLFNSVPQCRHWGVLKKASSVLMYLFTLLFYVHMLQSGNYEWIDSSVQWAQRNSRDGGHFSMNPPMSTAFVGWNTQGSVSAVLCPVLNKYLCLFWVGSAALQHNRAPADYLWLRGGQWFMTVFPFLYTSPLLQLSAAANPSKPPQRQEHRQLKISSSSESIRLSAKWWKCSFRRPNE